MGLNFPPFRIRKTVCVMKARLLGSSEPPGIIIRYEVGALLTYQGQKKTPTFSIQVTETLIPVTNTSGNLLPCLLSFLIPCEQLVYDLYRVAWSLFCFFKCILLCYDRIIAFSPQNCFLKIYIVRINISMGKKVRG